MSELDQSYEEPESQPKFYSQNKITTASVSSLEDAVEYE